MLFIIRPLLTSLFIVLICCSYTAKEHPYDLEGLEGDINGYHSGRSLNGQGHRSIVNPQNISGSGPGALADLDADPSAFVHCVNVITGQFCESCTDLVATHAVNPITVERSFCGTSAKSGALGPGWSLNHHLKVKNLSKSERKQYNANYSIDDQGVPLSVFTKKKTAKASRYYTSRTFLEKGVSNTSRGYIGGQSSVKNWVLSDLHDKQFNLRMGTGGVKVFRKDDDYRLSMEKKPTGNYLRYVYHAKSDSPVEVTLNNKASRHLQHLSIDQISEKLIRKNQMREIKTSDGRWVRYQFAVDHRNQYTLDKVEHCDGPEERYAYYYFNAQVGGLETIWKKMLPEGRFLEADYYDLGKSDVVGKHIRIKSADDPRIYRVSKLFAPVGTDATPIPIYQFIYHLNKSEKRKGHPRDILNGTCDVYNALGHLKTYAFDGDQRLTSVDKFHANGQHYTRESLFWGTKTSADITNLKTRTFEQPGLGIIFARTYEYDEQGNVSVDSLYGNLAGTTKSVPAHQGNGIINGNGSDCYRKECQYSKDGFNLLLSESDGFQTNTYQYAPNTNLLIAKFQNMGTPCCKRLFYSYNEDAALTVDIVDDGTSTDRNDLSGVTERLITYYTLNTLAYPLIIENKCLDLSTGQELLIHKVVNTYNNHSRVTKQDHYDNTGAYVYSLSMEYDDHGNMVKETDAMGRSFVRRYDANGNCLFQQGPRADTHQTFTYDFMNRLIRIDEIHADGVVQTTSNRYDYAGNLIAAVDAYGHETNYTYDSFGRITETLLPATPNQDGVLCRPVLKQSYDPLGNVITEIDARGIETTKSYTIRGQTASIHYADGSFETKIYQLNGILTEERARGGTVTRYTNDPLGRPIKIDLYGPSGDLLMSTAATYSTFHLLSETDPSGVTNYFTYYPDGKLKSQQKEESLTTFSYDGLGRVNRVVDHYGSNANDIIVTSQVYAPNDQLLEERTENGAGELQSRRSFVYDISGNLSQMITYSESGQAVTSTTYDSHGVPTAVTDPEGNKTYTLVKYDHRNAYGQAVPCQIVTDPLGNVTTVESDLFGRPMLTTIRNAFGKLIQKSESFYDLNGNCCRLIDTVILPDGTEKPMTTVVEYDTNNIPIIQCEAVGTPEQKLTRSTYNQYGQKENFIKADGIILSHTYDEMGRLESLKSSDGTVHYFYHYDANSNPVKIDDLIKGISTKCIYEQGRLIEETLSNGLSLKYTYDRIGRLLQLTFPDHTSIVYSYNGNQSQSISRLDDTKDLSYIHAYNQWDLSGHLISSTLPGMAGLINYGYDLLGRLKSINHPHYQESLNYDPIGCLIERVQQDIPFRYTYDNLSQLISEDGAFSHTYQYDSHYNRRDKDGSSYELNALNQILTASDCKYTYDLNGNMRSKESSKGIVTYQYDALDRLINLCDGEHKTTYTYDHCNRRIAKTQFIHSDSAWNEVAATRYLYQGQNEIGACNQLGEIIELRVLGNGKGAEIGASVAIEIGSEIYIPIHDHQGSVALLLNMEGDVVENYSYTSFGEVLEENSSLIPWGFSSKRYDPESGFLYFGRRYYDPSIGRWVTPDPIGREGGPNLYAYVGNNPMTNYDLYGLSTERPSVFSFIGALCSVVGDAIFTGYRKFADTWRAECPIPIVRDIFSAAGNFMSTGRFTNYKMEYSDRHSSVERVYGIELDPKLAIGYVPGIKNDEHSTLAAANYISEVHGNSTVHYTVNATHGGISDVCEVQAQKMGIPTNSVNQFVKMVKQMFESVGSDGRLILYGFSQGGQIIDCAKNYFSQADCDRISVRTLGSAKQIVSEDFGNVRNYVSSRDCIPFIADPLGYVRGCLSMGVETTFLKCNECPLTAHGFFSPTYQKVIEDDGRNFIKQYKGEK